MATAQDTFAADYVIVGAGSAGCVLANRLSADPNCRVLVVEAGGWDRDPWLHIPLAWGRVVLQRRHDWLYETQPAPNLADRSVPVYRGKVVGGSSSINAMAYVRGHASDYDRWAADGAAGWSYAEVLPYFQRMERWQNGADAWRGADGPLSVEQPKFPDPLLEEFLAAGRALGLPATDDFNGAQQEGFSRGQSTIRRGRRCSAARAYLHPVLDRPNLTVLTRAQVLNLAFEGTRITGLTLRTGRDTRQVRAEAGVILAAGAINSPQLLMLAGIGDPEVLDQHGIACRMPLPAVGQNLQDHMAANVDYRRTAPGPLNRTLRADRIVPALIRAQLFGTGIASGLPNNVMAFLRSGPDVDVPDLQLLFRVAPMSAGPWFPPFRKAYADGFGCRPTPLHPESRGSVTLASADPLAAPRVDMNFLSTDHDLAMIRAGIRHAREIVHAPNVRPYWSAETAPGPDITSDADLDAYARRTASTVYHPCGTCRMGPADDPRSVVTPDLKVIGTEGLHVVDASVMPDLTGGNINAPVIMIAERASDLIRGTAPLSAASA